MNSPAMSTPDQEPRKPSNARLALILGSIALVMFLGFIAKTWLLGRH